MIEGIPPQEARQARPIRLALVITELEVGGAERCLVNLATRIDRERFEPVVYSLGPRPAAPKDVLVQQLQAAGVRTEFLDLRSAWQFLTGIGRMTRLFREQKPEIVQTFLFHANIVGSLAARRAGVLHLATGIRVADPRRWRAWVERWACGNVDRVVCVSDGVAQHCRTRGVVANEKLAVIPNGIDVEKFAAARPLDLTHVDVPPGRKAIVYVGRLHVQKGLAEWIAGAPEMLAKLPNYDLVLVGDGPQRDSLQKLAGELQIADRVHFIGWRPDVPAILASAEMLVLPSRWEGMPNAVLEAMAAGKPVVATRAEGVVELLGEQANEQVVDVGDHAGLADRLIHLAQSPLLSAELGRRNQKRVAEEFSIEAMVGQYERLYASLVRVAK